MISSRLHHRHACSRVLCTEVRCGCSALEAPRVAEQGDLTLPDAAWKRAMHRMEVVIEPLVAIEVIGHQAADAAAHALGLSRRQVYQLIRRFRQDSSSVKVSKRWLLATARFIVVALIQGIDRIVSTAPYAGLH